MIIVFIAFGILYLSVMTAFVIGFYKLRRKSNEIGENSEEPSNIGFSIVVPFRNEANNLVNLLGSLHSLAYPSHLFEVVLVDDDSEDDSVKIILGFLEQNQEIRNFRLISNDRISASPKKDAISTAIKTSLFDWIITTDADCTFDQLWLSAYKNYIKKYNPSMIAGPVRYASNTKFITEFQKLDGYSLQTVTIGGFGLGRPLLCNGANLAYRKKSFVTVNGFESNDHIASGDDIFLMEKMLKWNSEDVHFLLDNSAIVTTQPQKSWRSLINQRLRWVSKTSQQKNWVSSAIGIIVFLVNFLILFGIIFPMFDSSLLPTYVAFLLVKIIVDFIVIQTSSNFFGDKIKLKYFLLSSLCYPLMVLRVVVSNFYGDYVWKGRKFEKSPKIK